jgi:predicted 2-oxoglutarate/Fe(II)-dependent dioxygenase YbiX
MAHTHPNHLVSGVYYVRTPPEGAPLVLSDPRGRFPPFDETVTLRPAPGDLVLFPSWLTHEVPPTSVARPLASY